MKREMSQCGIDRIDRLLDVNQNLQGDKARLTRRVAELEERNKVLTHELLWILVEVWPLVHGLTSRQCIKDRFKRLRDVINPKE